ncbi:MAG: DUF29 domain-containing protein [Acidisphaera sp.]|nr:DUF29 domain-containing protein [Acidisphaera sp.]
MPDDLYDRDALAWSERQASLLRRLAAGELVNADVDWPNVSEEIETVGRSELTACENLLVQALAHLLKLRAWPQAQSVPHWRGETVAFLSRAHRFFAPSMRQRIDLAGLYADALRQVRAEAGVELGAALPPACPYGLDDLLDPEADIATLVHALAGGPHG